MRSVEQTTVAFALGSFAGILLSSLLARRLAKEKEEDDPKSIYLARRQMGAKAFYATKGLALAKDGEKEDPDPRKPWLIVGEPCPYPYTKSTAEVYAVKHGRFQGRFAAVRRSRDYSYHQNYSMARQNMQDKICERFLATTSDRFTKNGPVPKRELLPSTSTLRRPFIIFTAGAMGSGNTNLLPRAPTFSDDHPHPHAQEVASRTSCDTPTSAKTLISRDTCT